MNLWAILDRLLAIASAPGRRLRSDDLVADIADGLATSGRYTTQVGLMPTRQVLDFNWAAQEAGRRLGTRIRVDAMNDGPSMADRVYVTVSSDSRLPTGSRDRSMAAVAHRGRPEGPDKPQGTTGSDRS